MSEPEFDLELIAAFTDGRLSGEERERAIRMLARSEGAFEVYAHALRVRGDLGYDRVLPIDRARRWRGGPTMWTIGSIAAAAVVMVAVLPVMRTRQSEAVIGASALAIADPLVRKPARLQTLVGSWDEPGWSVTRGGGGRLVDSTIAFRLGVRALDLQVALAAGDTAGADRLVSEMVETLKGVELSEPVQAEYAALRASLARGEAPSRFVASASRADQSADEFLQSFWFRFGRWVGAGELAARTQSPEFFAANETQRFLSVAERRRELAPDDVAALREVADLVGGGVAAGEFDRIRQVFRTLIRRHGG